MDSPDRMATETVSLHQHGGTSLDGAYRDGHELEHDVDALIVSLKQCHGQQALAAEVQRWFDLTRVFGLNLTRLDVRQDATLSRSHVRIAACSGDCRLCDTQRTRASGGADQALGSAKPVDETTLAPLTRETLSLFRMLLQAVIDSAPTVWAVTSSA
jgi:hypothetical protein